MPSFYLFIKSDDLIFLGGALTTHEVTNRESDQLRKLPITEIVLSRVLMNGFVDPMDENIQVFYQITGIILENG